MADSLGETTSNFIDFLYKIQKRQTIMDLLLVWDLLNTI
jgi:hypothetical protein